MEVGPGEALADTSYSDQINARMSVPRHISAGGGTMREKDVVMRQPLDMEAAIDARFRQSMNVPDRICVAGNDAHHAHHNDDISLDMHVDQHTLTTHRRPIMLSTPPSTLTLGHAKQYSPVKEESEPDVPRTDVTPPTFPRSFGEPLMPAQEMQLVRRQITRLCTQVYALEAQNESLRQQQYVIYMAGGVFLAIQVLKHIFK